MVKAIDLIGSNSQLQSHWFRRIIAAIIDSIILWIVSIIIVFAITLVGVLGFWWLIMPGLLSGFFMGIIMLLYFVILEGMSGATMGKRFMNLKVVSTAGRMDMIKALIRNISKIYWLIILLDWIIGLVTEGDPRQRMMDRIANTTVVRTDAQEIFQGAYQPPGGPRPAPMPPPSQYPPQYPAQQPQAPGQPMAAPPRASPPVAQAPHQAAPQPAPVSTPPEEVAGGERQFTRGELVNLRKDDLIKMARDKNLKVSGTKRDLIDRILGEEVT